LVEYNHVALFMTTSGMFEAALAITDHMLAVDPKDPDALVRAGEALLARGRYEEALERLDSGLQQQPKNAAAVRIKGLALYALGNNERPFDNFGAP
jgi:tetratricopeptide (TPR) repeat protein